MIRRPIHAPRPRRAGFTLAEVLLTVLIMSGILLSITKILQAARYSRDLIHNRQESHLAGPAIMDMIERDLRGLFTLNRTRQDHVRVTDRVLQGLDADSLDFVTTTNSLISRSFDGDRLVLSDVNEVGYRLRPNPNYDDFLEIYRREDLGVDEEPYEGGEFSFLHDRVKAFDIQVFTEDGPDAEPLEEWGQPESEEIGVPARIEVTMTIENANRVAREALLQVSAERRTMTYRRIIRLPEALRVEEGELVVLRIPTGPTGSGPAVAPSGAPGDEPPDGSTPDGATEILTSDGGRGGGGNVFGGGGR